MVLLINNAYNFTKDDNKSGIVVVSDIYEEVNFRTKHPKKEKRYEEILAWYSEHGLKTSEVLKPNIKILRKIHLGF